MGDHERVGRKTLDPPSAENRLSRGLACVCCVHCLILLAVEPVVAGLRVLGRGYAGCGHEHDTKAAVSSPHGLHRDRSQAGVFK